MLGYTPTRTPHIDKCERSVDQQHFRNLFASFLFVPRFAAVMDNAHAIEQG